MTDGSSGDVVRLPSGVTSSSNTFQLTGEVIVGASGLVTFTANALGRLSQAGIDPTSFAWTIIVGQYLEWSQDGLDRFTTALRTAPSHSSFQNILWFGFGHKSPIQMLAATENSSRFAAVCACLTALYSTQMAAQIMLALSKIVIKSEPYFQQTPHTESILPSLLQMCLLVEKCAGIFSTSGFAERAETFMSFDGERVIGQHAWPASMGRSRYTRGVSKPDEIAQAILGVARLAKGTLRNLSLVGVADCGAVAAIADWLFGLSIAIYVEDDKDEEGLRFCNSDNGEPQLCVLYTRKKSTRGSLIQRARTVYLSDATLLFNCNAQIRHPNKDMVLGGCVRWDSAFRSSFGEDFMRLLEMQQEFGKALGSAASIFTAIVEADESVPVEWLRRNSIHFPNSFGRNFVDFCAYRFAELRADQLQESMISTCQIRSYKEADAVFESSLDRIAIVCSCKICSSTDGESRWTQRRGYSTKSASDTPFCLVSLAATVIRLVRTLSGIDPIDDLQPKRAGLEYLYEITQTRILHAKRLSRTRSMPLICSVLERCFSDLPKSDMSLMRFAHHIFSGQTYYDESDDLSCSAKCSEGICYYFDILREPQQHDPIALTRVNVLPGHIEWDRRLFYKLGEQGTNRVIESLQRRVTPKKDDVFPDRVRRSIELGFNSSPDMILRESIANDRRPLLEVDFEVLDESGRKHRMGPAQIVYNIWGGSGLVACSRSAHQSSQMSTRDVTDTLERETISVPVCQITLNGSIVNIVDGGQTALLLAAFGCWNAFIQRDQCLTCCVQTGLRNKGESFVIVRTGLPGSKRLCCDPSR